MADFSLDLNEDQLQIQKWVHDFAEDVDPPRRPRVGRAGRDAVADHRGGGEDRPLLDGVRRQRVRRPHRAHAGRSSCEEMCWGDAGITLAIFGSTLGGLRHHRQRHARADRRVGAAVLRHAREDPARRVLRERARRRQRRVSSLRTRAVYDEAKDEWVLNGTKTWITNGGIADVHVVVASVEPELEGRGQASFVVPPGTPGLAHGSEVQEARHPRQPHRRGRPRRRARPRPLPARRQGEARRAPRARARRQSSARCRPR